jgi:hypothetical protein
VDTIIYVIMMIGASLAMALLFASTVLSYKWWNLPLIHRHHISKQVNKTAWDDQRSYSPQRKVVKVKLQSPSLVDLKSISNRSGIIKKDIK